jgi:heat shock protein HspQ
MEIREAKFGLGDVVKHRLFPFRGVVIDVDPEFANSEEWYDSIPEDIRPAKDQPFYHLLAENDDSFYGAYVSEQNLLSDIENGPVGHPQLAENFEPFNGQRYVLKPGVETPN